MILKGLIETLVALVALIWILRRQLVWQPVIIETMWRQPLLFAVLAAISLTTTDAIASLVDYGIIIGVGAVSVACGVLLGFLTKIRLGSGVAKPPQGEKHPSNVTIMSEVHTGFVGLLPWFAGIGAMLTSGVISRELKLEIASSPGVVFIVIGLTAEARNLVIARRLMRLADLPGSAPRMGK